MIRVATIARNPADSPNMTSNDAAILEQISTLLTERGVEVIQLDGGTEMPQDIDIICSMSRTASTLQYLKSAETRGVKVLNPTVAVENCSRRNFMRILSKNDIPQPLFKVIDTADELLDDCFPCWIKKAEGWSNHKDDVSFAYTKDEAIAAIGQLASRDIKLFIQMQHCHGDIVKFYGVGEKLFHYCYPTNSKFGHEEINGVPQKYGFAAEKLKDIAQRAAKAIGLVIYGGDAIITPQGDISIIDMNDFPSFTAIRDVAALEITETIMDKTE